MEKKDRVCEKSILLKRLFVYFFIISILYYLVDYIFYYESYEIISINELKGKNYNSVTVINEQYLLAKMNETIYKVIIPNAEYIEKHIDNDVPVYFKTEFNYLSLFLFILFPIMLISFVKHISGFKGIMDINKSIEIKHTDICFKDIIGQKNAVRSISEFVDILVNREKYTSIGAKVPRGALLSGPPGTGKTLLAKAVAGECNLPFINMCGSDFTAMFVGVGSARIRNLYEIAKQASEKYGGCIIFIDEIDGVGQKRNSNNSFAANSERENTLNQLLNEMDGFDENDNVITLAATNRPELLDDALLRPGRFDRKIIMDIPNIKDRIDLFTFYLSKLDLSKSCVKKMSTFSSKLTPGFSGADVKNVVNESAIIAVRNKKKKITESNIKQAIDYVMMGDIKDNILLDSEKIIVAYHETGHSILSCILPNVENPVKVSIVPREKGMLGFSQSEVNGDNLISKKKMEEQIIVLMGGRAAEEIFCDDITTGASNDIEKATQIANQYIKTFGFSDNNKFMNQNDSNYYKNDISNYIKDTTDKDVIQFLNIKYSEAIEIINNNKEFVEKIKNELLINNTIYYNDIKNIIEKKC